MQAKKEVNSMATDRQTKWVLTVIVVIALIGILFAGQQGKLGWRSPGAEYPYAYGASECCTCSRSLLGGFGGVQPGTSETLFKNVIAPDCASLCNYVHQRTRLPNFEYSLNAFVSNDPVCRLIKPAPRSYIPQPTAPNQRVGAGAYRSSPVQGIYE